MSVVYVTSTSAKSGSKPNKAKKISTDTLPARIDPKTIRVYDSKSGLLVPWEAFHQLPAENRKSATCPKSVAPDNGYNCCLRCGTWFKVRHKESVCTDYRRKQYGEYSF